MNRNYQLFEITRSPHIRKLRNLRKYLARVKIVLDSVNSHRIIKRASSIFHFSFLILPSFEILEKCSYVAVSLIFLLKRRRGRNNVVFFRRTKTLWRGLFAFFFKLIRLESYLWSDLLAGNSVNRATLF